VCFSEQTTFACELTTTTANSGCTSILVNKYRPAGASVWIASPIAYFGEYVISANASDEQQQVFDAGIWNFQNTTVNILATNAPPLRKT